MSNTDLKRAIEPIVRFFEEQEIDYHIGGSLSSSAHGVPRTTIDVDFVVDLKPIHVGEMVRTFKNDYYIDSAMIEGAIKAESSFNLIHLETFIKLDIFVLKRTTYAQKVMNRATDGILTADDSDRLHVKFSSAEDIILNKLHWFRLGGEQSERQWRDVIGVLNVQRRSLDFEYMQKWAEQIGVIDLLERIIIESEQNSDD